VLFTVPNVTVHSPTVSVVILVHNGCWLPVFMSTEELKPSDTVVDVDTVSGPGTALGRACVCVCLNEMTSGLDIYPWWFILIIPRSRSKVKVVG